MARGLVVLHRRRDEELRVQGEELALRNSARRDIDDPLHGFLVMLAAVARIASHVFDEVQHGISLFVHLPSFN